MDFLEILARVSVCMFEDSEMEEESLQWKLEHILVELFSSMKGNHKIIKNQIIIEDFSDSDDDY